MSKLSFAMDVLAARLARLEAEADIRRVLARYMHLCDQPCADTAFPQLGDLFTEDAVWEGVGSHYVHKFGRKQGREAVVAHVASYLAPSPHFRFNAHLLTSEAMRVEGDRACGQWIMQQISTYAAGDSDLVLARLNLDFRAEQGIWRISHFRTERLFAAPLDGTVCTALTAAVPTVASTTAPTPSDNAGAMQ